MVMENLGTRLRAALEKVVSGVFVDEKLINELMKDIQRALLQADVNVRQVFELTERIKQRSIKEQPKGMLTKREQIVHIVYEELVRLLGEKEVKIEIGAKPTKLMLVGLYGSGKTTLAGKLAKYYHKRGIRTALLQLDVWRPAAYEQLFQLGEQTGVPFYGIKGERDPLKIYRKYLEEFKKFDLVIIDTAGRDALSDELVKELNRISKEIKPEHRILVISADIGQAAERQAQSFHESCSITNVTVTKLDGTAKGGGALIACAVTGAKIAFIGTGEKVDDLEVFRPEGFVSRLLGMGDLQALLEKAGEAVTEEQAKDLTDRFIKGDFNLVDLYEQMEAVSKMGPLNKLIDMIPGFSQLKLPKDMLEVQEDKLKRWKHAMASMTKEELEEPDIIDSARMERISRGSGVPVQEIRELIKQYRQGKKMMRFLKGGASQQKMERMMKRLGKQGFPEIRFKG